MFAGIASIVGGVLLILGGVLNIQFARSRSAYEAAEAKADAERLYLVPRYIRAGGVTSKVLDEVRARRLTTHHQGGYSHDGPCLKDCPGQSWRMLSEKYLAAVPLKDSCGNHRPAGMLWGGRLARCEECGSDDFTGTKYETWRLVHQSDEPSEKMVEP